MEHPRHINNTEHLEISCGLRELLDATMGRLSEQAEGDKLELLYLLEKVHLQPLSYVRQDDLAMLWDLWYCCQKKVHCLLQVYKRYWKLTRDDDDSDHVTTLRSQHLSRNSIRSMLDRSISGPPPQMFLPAAANTKKRLRPG